EKFGIKDLGDLKWCLGMQVTQDRKKGLLKLDQTACTRTILKRFEMTKSKQVRSPAVGNIL
ncbi:unnamed protein product, partial [Chrysoparadoxa australica]